MRNILITVMMLITVMNEKNRAIIRKIEGG